MYLAILLWKVRVTLDSFYLPSNLIVVFKPYKAEAEIISLYPLKFVYNEGP